MAEFFTGEQLDDKLTNIIWEARKELIILSPFIRLDEYCKKIFSKLKNNPDLEIILVFGKNEGETQRSLNQSDLDFFKDFDNIVIIYCNNLHGKYYSNESEALLTSLNLLGQSMTGNVEYGIAFPNSKLSLDKLYSDSMDATNEVIKNNPCVFVKRPVYKKTNLGLSRKFVNSIVLLDETNALYRNRDFEKKFYNDFEYEMFETDLKPRREDFNLVEETKSKHNDRNHYEESGFCIRSGKRIPFNPDRPFSYESFQTWANFQDSDYPEKYCHRTGKISHGNTSMRNPIL
jgi:hypothetical protein